MSRNFRIIPKLEVKNKNLVKGVCHEGLRVLGTAFDYVRYYDNKAYDELIIIDCVASLFGTGSAYDLINEISSTLRMPLAYGGGLKDVNQCLAALEQGVDRVVLNSALFSNPELIHALTQTIGSANTIISVYTKIVDGEYRCFSESSRNMEVPKLDEWLDIIAHHFEGEILINSIEKDGLCQGIDQELVDKIAHRDEQTFLYSGGIRSDNDLVYLIEHAPNIVGAAIASAFHYPLHTIIGCSDGNNLNFTKQESEENNFMHNVVFQPQTTIHNYPNISCR